MINDAAGPDAKASSKPGFGAVLAAAVFVAAIHAVWWLFDDTILVNGNFADTDSYARLLRVLRLLETGAWFDNTLPRANWPIGGSLHWTRPFDVVLIAFALPMAPVVGMAKAVFWSGVLIGPVLHIVMVVLMGWAAAPLVGRAGALLAGALTALQFGVLGYAKIGNADHHLFMALIALAAFGFMVRALSDGRGADRQALAAGGVLALGYWGGMETQILAGVCIGIAGLRWVVAGGEDARETAFKLALGLTVGLLVALLAERGPAQFFQIGYDRISIVHLTLGGLILVFWTVIAAVGRGKGGMLQSWPGRLAWAVIGAALTMAIMGWLYPRIFINPLMDTDPALQAIYLKVQEYSPLGDVSHVLLYLGAGVFGVPWLAWRLKTACCGKSLWMWVLLAALVGVFYGFALGWIRWTLYGGLFMTIALADLLARTDGAIDAWFRFPLRTLIKVPVLAVIAIGPMALGAAGVYAEAQEKQGQDNTQTCPLQAVTAFLNRAPWADKPRAILSSANFGAELLYRTRHRVTATLHHTNEAGILDGFRILSGEDEASVRALIKKRDINLILLCPDSGGDGYFVKPGKEKRFYARLERGDVPGWIREVSLPAEAAKSFRLFEVISKP